MIYEDPKDDHAFRLTRRKFLQRSGAVTLGAVIALEGVRNEVRAQAVGGAGQEAGKPTMNCLFSSGGSEARLKGAPHVLTFEYTDGNTPLDSASYLKLQRWQNGLNLGPVFNPVLQLRVKTVWTKNAADPAHPNTDSYTVNASSSVYAFLPVGPGGIIKEGPGSPAFRIPHANMEFVELRRVALPALQVQVKLRSTSEAGSFVTISKSTSVEQSSSLPFSEEGSFSFLFQARPSNNIKLNFAWRLSGILLVGLEFLTEGNDTKCAGFSLLTVGSLTEASSKVEFSSELSAGYSYPVEDDATKDVEDLTIEFGAGITITGDVWALGPLSVQDDLVYTVVTTYPSGAPQRKRGILEVELSSPAPGPPPKRLRMHPPIMTQGEFDLGWYGTASPYRLLLKGYKGSGIPVGNNSVLTPVSNERVQEAYTIKFEAKAELIAEDDSGQPLNLATTTDILAHSVMLIKYEGKDVDSDWKIAVRSAQSGVTGVLLRELYSAIVPWDLSLNHLYLGPEPGNQEPLLTPHATVQVGHNTHWTQGLSSVSIINKADASARLTCVTGTQFNLSALDLGPINIGWTPGKPKHIIDLDQYPQIDYTIGLKNVQ